MSLSGDRVSEKELSENEMIKVGPLQYYWCPYKKRFGHQKTERKDYVNIVERKSTYKLRREAFEETKFTNTLISGFCLPEL